MTASYLDEIMEQPALFAALSRGLPAGVAGDLAQVQHGLGAGAFDRILLTGMGSSLYGAYPVYLRLAQSQSIPVLLLDASELVQQVPEVISSRELMIAISQSGESGEIVELTRVADRRPATVISVTNLSGNALANWADIPLTSNAGPELTVSSKSHTGGLACLHLMVGALTGSLPQAGKDLARAADAAGQLLKSWEPAVMGVAGFLDPKAPIVYVGRGKSLASAQLAGLLTNEAAKLPSTALSGGQFRHGPIELVRAGFQMVIFLGDRKTRDIDTALIDKVLSLGGKVVAVAPAASAPPERDAMRVLTYPDVPIPLNPIMEAMLVQLIQIPLAAARGFTAGTFLNATKITGVV